MPSALVAGAIGGPFEMFGVPDGWGDFDDDESIRSIRRAVDLGVTFFDTADAYGAGHSERILGAALAGRRDQVAIATKFGYTYDEDRRELTGTDTSPSYVREACHASLGRLGTDYLDLYQLHVGEVTAAEAIAVREALEDLVLETSASVAEHALERLVDHRLLDSPVPGRYSMAELVHLFARELAGTERSDATFL